MGQKASRAKQRHGLKLARMWRRLKRATLLDWILLAVAVLALVVPITYLVHWLVTKAILPMPIGLSLSIPFICYIYVSLVMVGLASESKPLINRSSLLWSWLSFIGSAARGGFVLIAGIVIGTITTLVVGSGPVVPYETLRVTGFWLILVFAGWFSLSIAVWTARASMDVAGRKDELRQNLVDYLAARGARKARQVAVFFEDGATVFFVVVAGLGQILAILIVVAWLAGLLGF